MKVDQKISIRLDIDFDESVCRGTEEALATRGRINVLVNNAGRGRPVPSGRSRNRALQQGNGNELTAPLYGARKQFVIP